MSAGHATLGCALWTWLAMSSATAARPDVTGLGYQQRIGTLLPLDLRFRDEQGQVVDLRSTLHGQPTLLVLGYYACPSLCGLIRDDTFSAISRAGLTAGRDYRLIFLSIDAAETPSLAAAAKDADLKEHPSPGAATAWTFLTGHQPDIDAVESAVGFHARYSAALQQFLHPAGLVVLTPEGRVASYLLGVGFTPRTIETALRDARAERMERSDNPVLLLCFHYDAAVGRYSLDIIKVLQLAGGITVLGIIAIVLLARRQGRRRLLDH